MADLDKPGEVSGAAGVVSLTLRAIMSGKEVGSIIGKGGEIINNIREESGAKIHITDGSVPERIVTVTGSTDAILKAYTMIGRKLEDDGSRGDRGGATTPSNGAAGASGGAAGGVTLRLIIPASQCGSLIGKGGSKIKEIRELTGATVQVASEMLPNSTERSVTVSGSRDAVTQVVYHICAVMVESPPKQAPILYTPKGGGAGVVGGASGLHAAALFGSASRGGSRGGGLHDSDSALASLLTLGAAGAGGASTLSALAALAGSQLRDRRDSGGRDRGGPGSGGNGGGSPQTYEMSIPNEHIGCIIGKGGSKIAEIRQVIE
jgi:predicted RNA-binding protein YlqC (UPF0109 family)